MIPMHLIRGIYNQLLTYWNPNFISFENMMLPPTKSYERSTEAFSDLPNSVSVMRCFYIDKFKIESLLLLTKNCF